VGSSFAPSHLRSDVTQAHIHSGQGGVAGVISALFCSNLPSPPPGTQACPPSPGTLSGAIKVADVVGPTARRRRAR
jgi:hypothetical protein